MEWVVDGYAHKHRAYADDDDGYLGLEERYGGEGEEPSSGHGEAHPQDVAPARHGAPEDERYEHHGEGNGQEAVVLDLCSVGITTRASNQHSNTVVPVTAI